MVRTDGTLYRLDQLAEPAAPLRPVVTPAMRAAAARRAKRHRILETGEGVRGVGPRPPATSARRLDEATSLNVHRPTWRYRNGRVAVAGIAAQGSIPVRAQVRVANTFYERDTNGNVFPPRPVRPASDHDGEARTAWKAMLKHDAESQGVLLDRERLQQQHQMLDDLARGQGATYTGVTAASAAVRPDTRRALRWFGRVTDGQYRDALAGTTVRRQVDTDPNWHEHRSYAETATREVVIAVENSRPQILSTLHELAHIMEAHNPDLLNRSGEWGRWRVARGWWRTSSELTASFWDYGVKAYFGYGHRIDGTEVVTMGLERMYRDPGKFARDDPDWWMFIYANVLRR